MREKQQTVVLRGQTNAVFAVAVLVLLLVHAFENPVYRDLDEALWPLRFQLLSSLRGGSPRPDLLILEDPGEVHPTRLAGAIRRLSDLGARTIALDVPLPEGGPGSAELAEALRASGKVVVSAKAEEGRTFGRVHEPDTRVKEAASARGYSVLARDGRGRMSRAAIHGLTRDSSQFGWPLVVVQTFLNIPGFARVLKDQVVTLKRPPPAPPLALPLDEKGTVWIDYGFRRQLDRAELAALERGELAAERIGDRLVVLPARNLDGSRTVSTPTGRELPRGVVLGCVLASILEGAAPTPASRPLEIGLLLLLGGLLGVLGWRKEPAWVLGGTILALLLWWGISLGLLLSSGVVLVLVRPASLFLLLLVAGALRHRFRTLVGVKARQGNVMGDAQAALSLGIKMMQAGKTNEAIKYFQKVAGERTETGMRGSYHLALVLLKKGDTRTATNLVKTLDMTGLGEDEAYTLAEELERTGQLDTAHTLFSKLVQTNISYRDVQDRLQKIQDRMAGVNVEDVARMISQKVIDPRFEEVDLLGRGGMGFVYKAKDAGADGRVVAIKVLSPFYANHEDVYRRFINEAEGIRNITHPNVIRIFDVFRENLPYYSMEFLTSASLKELMKAGRVPLASVVRLSHQVCLGLAAAHARNITHRDIKPDNIMLDGELNAKVIDFGIAHFEDQTRLTQTGHTIGTPLYMSPEQVKGEDIDHRSDIYSFGIVLFEMLAGKPPYQGMGDHLTEPIPDLPAEPVVPDVLRKVVRTALAKRREERFQSMAEFAEALQMVEVDG